MKLDLNTKSEIDYIIGFLQGISEIADIDPNSGPRIYEALQKPIAMLKDIVEESKNDISV